MLQDTAVEELRGRRVVDASGSRIGKIDEIYLDDDTGRPDWALVNTGLFGLKSSFVLIADAHEVDGEIAVPYGKDTVKDAPRIDPDGTLTTDEEAALFAHYGLEGGRPGSATAASEADVTAAPPGDSGGARAASGAGGPSASLAAAREAREAETGGDGVAAAAGGRTQADLDAERRGPEGPTGRGENEDPVPPDGAAPPRQDQPPAPPGATDGAASPSAVAEGVEKPPGAPSTHDHAGEHWEQEALPEHGNATATPEHGPGSPASETDALEAPETGDASAPRGGTSTGRARLRKYVADGSSEAQGPGSPSPRREGH